MSESIKDRFLKEHALSDDELDKVSGGDNIISVDCVGYGTCLNPSCTYYNCGVPIYGPSMNGGRYWCAYCHHDEVTDLDFNSVCPY